MTEWGDYLIENTDVLKNKYNITDKAQLKETENELVVTKLSCLYISNYNGPFNMEYLCKLHKYLFGDLYDFAGKYREVDMFKITGFTSYQEIDIKLKKLFKDMDSLIIDCNNKFDIAKYLSDYYYGLIVIHPFREGNGRTSREFIRELTAAKFPEYNLDYTKINKDNFQIGIIDHDRYPLLIAYEIYNALIPNEKHIGNTK